MHTYIQTISLSLFILILNELLSEKWRIWPISNYEVSKTVFSFQKRCINLITFGAHFFGIDNCPGCNSGSGKKLQKPWAPQWDALGLTHEVHERQPQTVCQALREPALHPRTVPPRPGRTRQSHPGVQGTAAPAWSGALSSAAEQWGWVVGGMGVVRATW